MRYAILFMILFWFLVGGSVEAVPCNLPTQSQVDKLVAAIWKNSPNSIDITLYRETIGVTMPEQEIIKMFEETFTRMYGPKDKLSGPDLERFNKDVRWNVERTLKEQQAGYKEKQRVRIDGYRQRIDQVSAQPAMVLLKGTPHESNVPEVTIGPNTPFETTMVNLGDKKRGDYKSFVYYHRMQTAQKSQAKGWTWNRSGTIDLAGFPMRSTQVFLGRKKDTPTGPVFVPDEDKIAKFSDTGKIGAMTICISPDPNTLALKSRIEMKNISGQVEAILVCDINDYSHVYYTEIRMPTTGKPLYIKESNDFDAQGFPHNVSVTEYDLDGNLKKKEIYEIVDVNLNPVVPDEVFAFNPPADYEIVEIDPNGTRKVIREKGGIDGAMRILIQAQKEKDVETLKGLLGHEIWQIRLRSLQVLESLLTQDNKKDLKEMATMLENDENQSVRERAEKILHRIKATELKDSSGKQ
jgi:hypothetical protein